MNAHTPAPSAASETDAPAPWERALLDKQLAILDRLAEMGMAIAGAVQARATAPEASDAAVQHAAMDFARVSRAVRMTLALQSKLVRDFKTPIKAAAADKDAFEDIAPGSLAAMWLEPMSEPEPARRPSEKDRLRDAVRRAAEESGLEAEAVERLDAEARERLERDDMDRIMHRPFDQIVALICEELGLNHLPPEGAGGGPSAEEPMVEGAGGRRPPFNRFPERPPAWSG